MQKKSDSPQSWRICGRLTFMKYEMWDRVDWRWGLEVIALNSSPSVHVKTAWPRMRKHQTFYWIGSCKPTINRSDKICPYDKKYKYISYASLPIWAIRSMHLRTNRGTRKWYQVGGFYSRATHLTLPGQITPACSGSLSPCAPHDLYYQTSSSRWHGKECQVLFGTSPPLTLSRTKWTQSESPHFICTLADLKI